MTAENLAMDENTPAVVKGAVYAAGGLTTLGAGGLFFAGGSGGGLAAGAFRLPPIARGNFIETALATAFGGGLPRTFPVIDRFLNGVATSVKSLDLMSKTYQNANRLMSTLTGCVDKLTQFNGGRLGNVQVQGSAITQRVLEVVVQRGAATPQQIQAIQQAASYAKENDVLLKVIMVKYGAIYERRGKLIVHADSKTVAGVLIGVPPYVVLEASADAAEVGRTMRCVLEHSKMNLRHPEPHEWDAVARPLYDAVGAKSWGTFARAAQLVSVEADGETIRLHPQENRGARDGFQPMGLPVIEVPHTVADDQLGLAIRESLRTASAREHRP